MKAIKKLVEDYGEEKEAKIFYREEYNARIGKEEKRNCIVKNK